MIAAIGGFLAKSALMQSPLGGLLRLVPRKAWLCLAIAAVVGFVAWRALDAHGDAIQRVKDEAYASGRADQLADQVAAQRIANKAAAAINTDIRKKSDEEIRRIDRDADALLVRGPGKAACPRPAAASGPAGGHGPANRPADAPVDQVPDPERVDLIAVPFADAISFAEQHDKLRSEALSWRESDRRQAELADQSKPKE